MEHNASSMPREATRSATDHTPSRRPDMRPVKYGNFEAEMLATALQSALRFPEHTWRLWAVMAFHIQEMNAHFRSVGEPQLKLVSFGTFRELVRATIKRQEASDE